MNHEEYSEIYIQMIKLDEDFKPVIIPIDPLPNESPYETILRFMEGENMVIRNGEDIIVTNEQKIIDYDKNLMKIIDCIWLSQQNAIYDSLEEIGLMYTTVDENGNIVRELTDAGKAALDDENYSS